MDGWFLHRLACTLTERILNGLGFTLDKRFLNGLRWLAGFTRNKTFVNGLVSTLCGGWFHNGLAFALNGRVLMDLLLHFPQIFRVRKTWKQFRLARCGLRED